MSIGNTDILRSIVDRLEKLEESKQALQEDTREVMAEARGAGFNVKIIRKVLQVRKMKPHEAIEEEELLHIYLDSLRRREKDAAA